MATANVILSPGAIPEPLPSRPPEMDWQQNLNIRLTCDYCKEDPPNLIEDAASGDTICESCGTVLAHHFISQGSEWRTFSNDDQGNDDPSRVGEAMNPLLNGAQLETGISFGDGGARSRELHRAQNKTTLDKGKTSLMAVYKQIQALCDSCQLPHNVTDAAKALYKIVDDAKAFKGKSNDSIIASCIFIACRQERVDRTFKEIVDLTGVAKKEIGRTFKALEKFFSSQNNVRAGVQVTATGQVTLNGQFQETSSTTADKLAERYCSKLGLSHRGTRIAMKIAERCLEIGSLAGRSPLSIASAAIFMASHLVNDPKTPKEIGAAAGVSDGTIRTSYKGLYEHREVLLQDKKFLTDKGGDMSRLPPS